MRARISDEGARTVNALPRRRLDVRILREAARGQWTAFLPQLGVDVAVLTRRHSPCPGCGGRDRFRFDDRDGAGSFICGRGGDEPLAGDGFALLSHVHGWSFGEALAAVARALGLDTGDSRPAVVARAKPDPEAARRQAAEARQKVEHNRARFQRWLREAAELQSGDAAARYLSRRGLALEHYPFVLRTGRQPYHHDAKDKRRVLGNFPAMLAALQGADGRLCGVHVTYLASDGTKAALADPETGETLPARKLRTVARGAASGAAVRLYPAAERLTVAEGIETALAVHQLTGLPVWACLSTAGMKRLALPPTVRDVLIAADHDANGAGKDAAHTLARRLLAEGRTVRVEMPARAGTDWLDVLNREG